MFEWITEMSDPDRIKVVSIMFFIALALIPLGMLVAQWGDREWYYRNRQLGARAAKVGSYTIVLSASFAVGLLILIIAKGVFG